jgi:hypothetical protein
MGTTWSMRLRSVSFQHYGFALRAQNPRTIIINGKYVSALVAHLLVPVSCGVIGIDAMETRGLRTHEDFHGVAGIKIGVHIRAAMGARASGYYSVGHGLPPLFLRELSAGDTDMLVEKCEKIPPGKGS